jgi:RNA polymerase sigma factor (sigma-70 family)
MALRSFPTTRWSLILSSATDAGAQAEDALAELCRTYWYPAYSFIRARTASADDAQDLTQEFFLHFLKKGILRSANPATGRFRSYLAGSLKHFLADQADRRNAQKRGGAAITVSIDLAQAEARYARDLEYRETPDKIFDRQWAVAIVRQTCDQLRDLLAREGRELWFDRLQNFLPGGSEPCSYATVAGELGMTEAAIKVAIHRLRRRYRDLLRANVSHTLADPEEVDIEIRFLLNSLSPSP